jgi:hypothetical protein
MVDLDYQPSLSIFNKTCSFYDKIHFPDGHLKDSFRAFDDKHVAFEASWSV